MVIKADEEGKNAIMALLNLALETGGMKNRVAVNIVFDTMEDINPEKEEEKEK